jgi:hypothetical protein
VRGGRKASQSYHLPAEPNAYMPAISKSIADQPIFNIRDTSLRRRPVSTFQRCIDLRAGR